LPDFFGLYDDLTVREYLQYFARAYGLSRPRRDSRVAALIESCRLAHKQNEKIRALSRGLKQRVGIARTLINDPPALLLDEPAAGLDPEARAGLQELFRSLGGQGGRTLIVSSHILTELEDYCTHVAMLNAGRLVSFSEIDGLRAASSNARRLRALAVDGAERAEAALRSNPRASSVRREGPWLSFAFAGDERAQAELLAALLASGAQIAQFEPESGRIQDAYLSLMKGSSE
jgi:ABC-2 type transport system ATP-binding protein